MKQGCSSFGLKVRPLSIRKKRWLHVDGEEDCLYLNVFAKTEGIATNFAYRDSYIYNYIYKGLQDVGKGVGGLPVVVWLHGGGFTSGRASDASGEFLMAEDIILVVPQYR